MRNNTIRRFISGFLIVAMGWTLVFSGCGNRSSIDEENNTEITVSSEEDSRLGTENSDSTEEKQTTSESSEAEEKEELPVDTESIDEEQQQLEEQQEEELRHQEEEQKEIEEAQKEAERKKAEEERVKAEKEKEEQNSFSMMYYLAITAEDIRTSRKDRLILDDIYTSLLNDINPGSIDEVTQEHLQNLRDIIKTYLNINTKRERMQYIYNQDKASAIRKAIPNPLSVLSMSQSLDWKRLAVSAVYSIVDSYNNFKNANESAEKEYLLSGWELDDEELENVQKNRERAFDYMVDMVQNYGLDGLKTLSEKDIEKFSEICALSSPAEKIQRLKAEETKYELLGNYWLELADCYFQTDRFRECLDCVDKYKNLSIGIYRKDENYAQILPKVIVAAQKTYKGDQYIAKIRSLVSDLVNNTSTDDWSMRYFSAQVYLDLYARTNNTDFLDEAYDMILQNVTVLLEEQRKINNTYLEDVKDVEIEEPDYRYMSKEEQELKKNEYNEEKNRVNAYNKNAREERKTELPHLYEPLILNCELLFALADKKNIGKSEKHFIDELLQTESNGIFLTDPVNEKYSFYPKKTNYSISLSKKEITIPVSLLTSEAKIEVSVSDNGVRTEIEDCKIDSVSRNGKSIDDFSAKIVSKQWKKYNWTDNSQVTVKITYPDAYDEEIVLKYKVSKYEKFWLFVTALEFTPEK